MIGQDRPGTFLLRERGAGQGWLGYLKSKNKWHLRSLLSLELAVASGGTSAVFVCPTPSSLFGELVLFHADHVFGMGLPITVSYPIPWSQGWVYDLDSANQSPLFAWLQ